ncbi:MAG: alpha/beta fold hydrolase [Thermofilum sp.]
MMVEPSSAFYKRLVVASIAMMLLGSLLAYLVLTDFGNVKVTEVRFYGTSGELLTAWLFVPSTATPQTPAPGILAIHGYNNQRDFMTNTAIELARRGYVVLVLDMTGHGFSEGSVYAFSFGAPSALNYLRNLAYVDKENIGLVGMSMGGWAIQAAALANPTGYKAMFYMDSYVRPPEVAKNLRNVAIQMALADEFTAAWLLVPTGWQAPKSPVLKTIFNVTEDIVPGKVYGSIEKGTARVLYQPWINHPQSTDDPTTMQNVIEWFSMTLKGGKPIPKENLVFQWKVLGTAIALVGAFLFLFAFGGYLLETSFFSELKEPMPEYKGLRGIPYIVGAVIATAIPPLLYLYGWVTLPTILSLDSTLLPLGIANRYLAWSLLVALVTLVIIYLTHRLQLRKHGATTDNYGLTWAGKVDFRKVAKSFLLAVAVLAPLYVILAYSYSIFKVPFACWLISLRPMSWTRFLAFLAYLIPFAPFYLTLNVLLAGFIRPKAGATTTAKEMLVDSVVLAAGSIIFLLWYYIPLYAGMVPPLSATYDVLAMIYYIPIPVFNVLTACLTAFYFRKTGRVYAAFFLQLLFFAWYHAAFSVFHVPALP